MSLNQQYTDQYQELFEYLLNNLGAVALQGEMDDIIEIVGKINYKPAYENHPDDCAHPSDEQFTKTIGGAVNCETTVIACKLCGAHLTEPQTDC